jgi:PAS domain S-box-containing protein
MLEGLDQSKPSTRRATIALIATALLVAVAAAVATWFVVAFVEDQRQRDLVAWQTRMGERVDVRANAVDAWLNAQAESVAGVAANTSVQLYFTELAAADGERARVTEEEVQAQVMRNLLEVTAERSGFTGRAVGPAVPANVGRQGVAGMAVFDPRGQMIARSGEFPASDERLRALMARALEGRPAFEDMFNAADGAPTIAFAAPIMAIQGDGRPAGVAVGVRPVARDLFPLLSLPRYDQRSAETMLIRRVGGALEYLSPLADNTPPLGRRMDANTASLAEAQLASGAATFTVARDYRSAAVLAAGRSLQAAPWFLIHKLDSSEALADSDARLNRLMWTLLGVLALVGVAAVALWRHGASRRASTAAAQFREIADRFERQGKLLRLVTDTQPADLFIVDAEDRVRYANRGLAQRVGAPVDDLPGKPMASVFGPEEAKRYQALNREALEQRRARAMTHRLERDGRKLVVVTEHVPLAAEDQAHSGVLVVENDITEIVAERERRTRILAQVVRTLVAAVDRRDPHAAQHSQRVAQIARALAQEMQIDAALADAAETAGNLMNIGKLLVPADLLTRAGALTQPEITQIRESLKAGVELLAGIEFDGPVVDTLRQAQERWDGAGPLGLAGEAILPTARVIAVANTLVALTSQRAHRAGLSADDAVATIQADAGKAYDRRVVAALVNWLENRDGRGQLAAE